MIGETAANHISTPLPLSHRAIAHYYKAIEALTRDDLPRIEVVLVSSIVLFTFDNFNSCDSTAAKHIIGGVQVMKEWQSQKTGTRVSVSDQLITEEIGPILSQGYSFYQACVPQIEPSTDTNDSKGSAVKPETPADVRTTAPLNELVLTAKAFVTFREACSSLNACARILKHGFVRGSSQGSTLSSLLGRWIHGYHLSKVECWPCENKMLLLHHFTLFQLTTCLPQSREGRHIESDEGDTMEDLEAAFDKIVQDMDDLLTNHPLRSSKHFQRELGLIAPLFTTGVQCTSKKTRNKAVRLLRSLVRKEGGWTSSCAAHIAESVGLIRSANPDAVKARGSSHLMAKISVECGGGLSGSEVSMQLSEWNPEELSVGENWGQESEWHTIPWQTDEIRNVQKVWVAVFLCTPRS